MAVVTPALLRTWTLTFVLKLLQTQGVSLKLRTRMLSSARVLALAVTAGGAAFRCHGYRTTTSSCTCGIECPAPTLLRPWQPFYPTQVQNLARATLRRSLQLQLVVVVAVQTAPSHCWFLKAASKVSEAVPR